MGGLSPAGVNVGLRAVRVVEARLVVRVSGRVGEVRVAADEARAVTVDLGGADSEFYLVTVSKSLCTVKEACQWERLGEARTKR